MELSISGCGSINLNIYNALASVQKMFDTITVRKVHYRVLPSARHLYILTKSYEAITLVSPLINE